MVGLPAIRRSFGKKKFHVALSAHPPSSFIFFDTEIDWSDGLSNDLSNEYTTFIAPQLS